MRWHYFAGRLFRPGALVVFFIYAHVFKRQRARVLVVNEHNEVLLVRDWIGPSVWELPGGGVGRNETPQRAAQRELQEETGITAPLADFDYLTTLHVHGYDAPIYVVHVLKQQLPEVQHNPWEIVRIGWYPQNQLPRVDPMVVHILQKLAVTT